VPKSDTPTNATTSAAASTPAPNPPESVGSGSIAIYTKPAGLQVIIDGKAVGASPARATLPQGDHTYTYTCPDSDPDTKTFKIKPGSLGSVTVTCKAD
jgi:PEGA domain